MVDYFNTDVIVIRLLWVFISLFIGLGVIAYLIAAIVIPESPKCSRNTLQKWDLPGKNYCNDPIYDRAEHQKKYNYLYGLRLSNFDFLYAYSLDELHRLNLEKKSHIMDAVYRENCEINDIQDFLKSDEENLAKYIEWFKEHRSNKEDASNT